MRVIAFHRLRGTIECVGELLELRASQVQIVAIDGFSDSGQNSGGIDLQLGGSEDCMFEPRPSRQTIRKQERSFGLNEHMVELCRILAHCCLHRKRAPCLREAGRSGFDFRKAG